MRAADAVCQQQMLASDATSDMEYLMEEQVWTANQKGTLMTLICRWVGALQYVKKKG